MPTKKTPAAKKFALKSKEKPAVKKEAAKKAVAKKLASSKIEKPVVKKTVKAKVVAPKKVIAPKAAPKVEKTVVEKTPEPLVVPETAPAKKSVKAIAKSELVKKYRSNAKDTGSVSVQAALLTDRIAALSKHLAKHIHDSDSKRGLLIAVGKRRRLLNYVRTTDPKTYEKLIKDLKLKK